MNLPPSETSLAIWLSDWVKSSDYRKLVHKISALESMTPPEETACIYGLIQRLRPALCLEIGTFFAVTTRVMAQAMHDAAIPGKIITLDPYGQARVPDILRAWPPSLQPYVEYRGLSSMDYFMEMETQRIPIGAASPLALAFVDGHHSLEYALFDITRAAAQLKPGGAIVVDNLEQAGPSGAVCRFLAQNPAWMFFYQGQFHAEPSPDLFLLSGDEILWGVLIAPDALQVAGQVTKFTGHGCPDIPIKSLELKTAAPYPAGILHANFVYYAVPFDYHLTGQGVVRSKRQQLVQVLPAGHGSVILVLPEEIKLALTREDVNIGYQLELWFAGEDKRDFLLLDSQNPLVLKDTY